MLEYLTIDLMIEKAAAGGVRHFGGGQGKERLPSHVQCSINFLKLLNRTRTRLRPRLCAPPHARRAVHSNICPAHLGIPQVTFHDTARMRKRVPLLSDFFGFTCGALGEKVGNGCICGWVCICGLGLYLFGCWALRI